MTVHVSASEDALGPQAAAFDWELLRELDTRRGSVKAIGIARYDRSSVGYVVTQVGVPGYIRAAHGTEAALASHAAEIIGTHGAFNIEITVLNIEDPPAAFSKTFDAGDAPCSYCGQGHLGNCTTAEEIADFDRTRGLEPEQPIRDPLLADLEERQRERVAATAAWIKRHSPKPCNHQ
jgi:hypothetical protein